MTEDHVTFRRQISDGNYGSETVEVVVSLGFADDDPGVKGALARARWLVQEELLRSPNPGVRRTLERELKPAADSAGHPPSVEEVPF